MSKSISVQKMTAAAILIALGIVIPMFMPIRVVLEPASFTLASHVAVFLSMFISPTVAVCVAAGTTLGFFFGGFPIVVVLRAATHLVFAFLGAWFLQKHPDTLAVPSKATLFSLGIGLIHGLCEFFVVSAFYFGGNMTDLYYSRGFLTSVFLLVGVGSVVHSMVDFGISLLVFKVLRKQPAFRPLFCC